MDNSENNNDLTDIFLNKQNSDSENINNTSDIGSLTSNKINNDIILTMKVNLSENKVNDVLIPESVNIDKLIQVPKKKYLEEVIKYKKDEIEDLKNEIKEENEKKMEFMFKQLMNSFNYNNFTSNDKIINQQNNSEIDDDPFKMDYTKIKTKTNKKKIINSYNSIFSDSTKYVTSEISIASNIKKENKQTKILNYNFSEYFDCVYLINLPDERYKLKNIINIFDTNKVKYKIIDGVYTNNNIYSKYLKRWEFQKHLDYSELSKFLFDEKIYLKNNQDLKNILSSKSSAWKHWKNNGRFENRILYDITKISLESQLGNLIAHINVLKDAIKNKYDNILVLEDDVFINKDFNEIHENIISKIPDYSILYYGGIQKKWENINIENGFYKAENTYGGFAYALRNEYFNYILEQMEELVYPIDKLFINIQNSLENSYVIYPNIFITDLENGKIHRKRDFKKYSKHFKWKVENYIIPKIE